MAETDELFDQLANALDRLANRFPRTESGIELEVLRAIYTAEEAQICARLTGEALTAAQIAAVTGLPEEYLGPLLRVMLRKGLVWPDRTAAGNLGYRLAPFIVGVYESQRDTIDHRLAHLVEEYFAAGGTAGIMSPGPALHRVIPADSSVKSEWIMPYDRLKPILAAAKSFTVGDCICRKQQALIGEPCRFPLRVCLGFSSRERPAGPHSISRDEALAILDEAERVGLVHTVSNVAQGFDYICNCCSCCCGILRGLTEFGIDGSVAVANYYAEVEPDLCSSCGLCTERCQVGAVSLRDDAAVVVRERCIGCGLCVTTCPTGAVTLHLKPEDEIVDPPEDFSAWEQERLARRTEA